MGRLLTHTVTTAVTEGNVVAFHAAGPRSIAVTVVRHPALSRTVRF